MNLREALITQAPSLELQRAAQAEIARLDHQITQLERDLDWYKSQYSELTEDIDNMRAAHLNRTLI